MSRITNYQDKRFTVVSGLDHMLGNFIQLYDKELEDETPEGEGLVLDWSEGFGISSNYTGSPVNNNAQDVMLVVGNYISERVHNIIIITAEQNFSLN